MWVCCLNLCVQFLLHFILFDFNRTRACVSVCVSVSLCVWVSVWCVCVSVCVWVCVCVVCVCVVCECVCVWVCVVCVCVCVLWLEHFSVFSVRVTLSSTLCSEQSDLLCCWSVSFFPTLFSAFIFSIKQCNNVANWSPSDTTSHHVTFRKTNLQQRRCWKLQMSQPVFLLHLMTEMRPFSEILH